MKKTMLVATFLAVGAGSAGVSALDGVKMQGSDTLKDFTLTVITAAACPASVGISYIGGGSGPGETNMINSANGALRCRKRRPQCPASSPVRLQVACARRTPAKLKALRSPRTASPSRSPGLTSRVIPGSSPGSAPNADCNAGPATGIRTATLSPWLGRLTPWATASPLPSLRAGVTYCVKCTSACATRLARTRAFQRARAPRPTWYPRDCASAERLAIVNNWGNLFETTCTTGSCTQLSHAWRRDLLSGTTDVFRELINAKLYPFCNQRFAFDPQPTLPQNPPTKLALYPSGTVRGDGSPIFEDPYQDFDPNPPRVCRWQLRRGWQLA
ncbi:MAG: hypothetical protein WDO74_31720 [Pseudomonadota bacterium]